METPRESLVVVTGNKGKAAEIGAITGWNAEAVGLDILEIQSLDVREVARQKALAAFSQIQRPLVVDDTAMSIEALNGLPGALVSWFLDSLGPEGILDMLRGKSNRSATVATCVAYIDANGVHTFLGEVEGQIPEEARGSAGFGYDPIFIPDGFSKTYAEMTSDEKNSVSMRRRALDQLRDFLLTKNSAKHPESREEILALYASLKDKEPRRAAEVAYVLARLALASGDKGEAVQFARESIGLFESANPQTLEECAASFSVLGGIAIPSLIHEGVVRDRLRELGQL